MIKEKIARIEKNKLLWQVVWIAFFVGVIAVLISSIIAQDNSHIKGIGVLVLGETETKELINKKELKKKIVKYFDRDIRTIKMADLDLIGLENYINKDDRLKNAEVYIDARNRIQLVAELRQPIARVMASNGEDYYLDEDGNIINPVKNAAVRVPIITGNIDKYKMDWKKDSKHDMNKIMELITSVRKNDFLMALFEQFNFDNKGELTAIPKVGKPIVLGSTMDLDVKLSNLRGAYKGGMLKTKVWNTIERFSFKIPNQYAIERSRIDS